MLLAFGSKEIMSLHLLFVVWCLNKGYYAYDVCLDLNDYQEQFDQLIHLHLFLHFHLTKESS